MKIDPAVNTGVSSRVPTGGMLPNSGGLLPHPSDNKMVPAASGQVELRSPSGQQAVGPRQCWHLTLATVSETADAVAENTVSWETS